MRSEEARRFFYLGPRAYPAARLDPVLQARSVARLRALYDTLGRRPIGPVSTTTFRKLTLAEAPKCLWHSLGPSNLNGRVTGLAIAPTDPLRIYASTVGGLWRSSDGALGWQRVSDELGGICMGAVAVAPEDRDLVFAGRGDPNLHELASGGDQYGLFVSSAGGDPGTWKRVLLPLLDRQVVSRIRIGPGMHPEVFAATSAGVVHGVWAATDWAWSLYQGMSAPVSDIAVDFSGASPIVYAAVWQDVVTGFSAGVYRFPASTGTGSWERLGSGFPASPGWTALALAPSNPGVLYAKVATPDRRLRGIYRRGSSGTWQNRTSSSNTSINLDDSDSYTDYNCVIEVDPTNENVVYVGGVRLYRTLDASVSTPAWVDCSRGNEIKYLEAALHDDVHAIAFRPGNPNFVLVGNDGGIDQSTDLSKPLFHWEDHSHGMTITEFYRVAAQQQSAGAFAGGAQDNGSSLTFGNRTWYSTNRDCDGSDVALEPGPSMTFLEACLNPTCTQTHVDVVPNPVPGTADAGEKLPSTAPKPLYPPMVTAPGTATEPGRELAATCPGSSLQQLMRSRDAMHWEAVPEFAPPTALDTISAIAVAPSSDFAIYYVGFRGRSNVTKAGIWTSLDGGTTRLFADLALPELCPNAIAVDPADADHAFAALGGGAGGAGRVIVTTDQGRSWKPLAGPGSSDVFAAPATGVVLDPRDRSILYVSTSVGVFRATIDPVDPALASWQPMSDGLPLGVDVTSLALATGPYCLLAGTMGYGAFTLDLGATACPAVVLSVRDNVFDRGETPSPVDIPDPEHPITDPFRASNSTATSFYRANDHAVDRLNWWSSPDIRLHHMDASHPENELAWADGVAIETCPTEASDCMAGTNVDADAKVGDTDTVYVQVTNRGTATATGLRVMALWGDATLELQSLPANFWSTVFPTSGECAELPQTAPWHTFDPPCFTVDELRPDESRVLTFKWVVPSWAASHSCVLAFVESPDDPIPARLAGELDPDVFVQTNHQIGLRNLHVVDGVEGTAQVSGNEQLILGNAGADTSAVDIEVSRGTLPPGAHLALLLPKDWSKKLDGIVRLPAVLTAGESRRALAIGADSGARFVVPDSGGAVRGIRIRPRSSLTIGVSYDTGHTLPPNTAGRFTVVLRRHGRIIGGSTYILRAR